MRKNGYDGSTFADTILDASKINFSRIVLALDLEGSHPGRLLRTGKQLLEKTSPYLCGVKLGRQTVLNLGTDRTKTLLGEIRSNELPSIIDDKLNDIDETNAAISQAYFNLGFDCIIVNPFVGWKGGLQPVFQLARKRGRGVIVLVYMSHPGATEGYGQFVVNGHGRKPRHQFEVFADRATLWKADGAVVGATRPDIVKKVKARLRNTVLIYSPGIGTQGGKIRQAAKAGTDFFIVGRSITNASRPEEAVQAYARESIEKNP